MWGKKYFTEMFSNSILALLYRYYRYLGDVNCKGRRSCSREWSAHNQPQLRWCHRRKHWIPWWCKGRRSRSREWSAHNQPQWRWCHRSLQRSTCSSNNKDDEITFSPYKFLLWSRAVDSDPHWSWKEKFSNKTEKCKDIGKKLQTAIVFNT